MVIVTPQSNLPACGLRFPLMISKRAVMARGSRLKNTILSPFSTLKFTSLNKTTPSSVSARNPDTSRIWFPGSRSGVKIIPGYLREDGLISSTFSFSNIFLRLVVCLLFATLALNRRINSSNSFFFSSAFAFWFCC